MSDCTDYSPDIQMQGDCRNCGNTYASHQPRTYTQAELDAAVKAERKACATQLDRLAELEAEHRSAVALGLRLGVAAIREGKE